MNSTRILVFHCVTNGVRLNLRAAIFSIKTHGLHAHIFFGSPNNTTSLFFFFTNNTTSLHNKITLNLEISLRILNMDTYALCVFISHRLTTNK